MSLKEDKRDKSIGAKISAKISYTSNSTAFEGNFQKMVIVWGEFFFFLQPCIKSFLQINKMQIVLKFTRSKAFLFFSGDTIIYSFPECGFKHFVERQVWDFGRRALISLCFQCVETLSLFRCSVGKNSPHITF